MYDDKGTVYSLLRNIPVPFLIARIVIYMSKKKLTHPPWFDKFCTINQIIMRYCLYRKTKGAGRMEHITYSQMRILETAQSFRQLNDIYGEAGNADDVVGTQLAETARLLEEAAGVGMRAYTADSRTDRLIRKSLVRNRSAHRIGYAI